MSIGIFFETLAYATNIFGVSWCLSKKVYLFMERGKVVDQMIKKATSDLTTDKRYTLELVTSIQTKKVKI